MPEMPEFTKVNSLETSIAVYSVGKIIKFWDMSDVSDKAYAYALGSKGKLRQ